MARAADILQNPVFVREAISYKPALATFVWRKRPRRHFSTNQGWRTFNNQFAGMPAGYIASDGRRTIRINNILIQASRIAWVIMTGVDPGDREIDHVDTDPSNDRWSNLRLATHRQNMNNKRRRCDNKSGFKGVWKKGGRYVSQIKAGGITYHLGTYDTPEEAHAAYCEASARLHGKFGRTS